MRLGHRDHGLVPVILNPKGQNWSLSPENSEKIKAERRWEGKSEAVLQHRDRKSRRRRPEEAGGGGPRFFNSL